MQDISELSNAARHYGESEEWKVRFDEAEASFFRLEKQLVYGIYLFDAIAASERAIRAAVASGAFDPVQVGERVRNAWKWWLTPCDNAEAHIREYEKRGCDLAPAKDFRDRCKRARQHLAGKVAMGSWKFAVKQPNGRLFGKTALTVADLRKMTVPFPDPDPE